MSAIDSIAALPAGMASLPTKPNDPSKVRGAAQQFEALMMGMLLKSAREAGGTGWLDTGDGDDAGQLGLEVAEQQFAQMLASGGGLGLAKLVQDGLNRESSERATAPAKAEGTQ